MSPSSQLTYTGHTSVIRKVKPVESNMSDIARGRAPIVEADSLKAARTRLDRHLFLSEGEGVSRSRSSS